jgi:H/ACA ribonucleoprotein complex subunit 1
LKAEIEDVPYFNAPIYLENKSQIGKIDEIFGTLRDYSVSVKLSDNMRANSFQAKQKLFIDPAKLLPLARFLPQPPKQKGVGKKKGDKGGAPGGGGKLTSKFRYFRVSNIQLIGIERFTEHTAKTVTNLYF